MHVDRLAAAINSAECGEGPSPVGENRRYDRPASIDAATDAEVRALRIIAGLVGQASRLVTDRVVARQVEEVLRAAATELANGRAVPLAVRRAVRRLADAIRAALDPRPGARGAPDAPGEARGPRPDRS